MDAEKIIELVDGFVDQLKCELVQLSKNFALNAEGAVEEAKMLGLSQEEAPYLIFNLADPMGAIESSQKQCLAHTNHMFDICQGMDPEEETFARTMIVQRLRELHEEINFLFSSADN